MAECVNISKGRTPELFEQTQKLSDYLKALPLSCEQNNTLIEMVVKHLIIAEQNSFRYAMKISSVIIQRLSIKEEFEAPSEDEFQQLISDAIDFLEDIENDKLKN